jgi:splicing factor 3A subunit 3
METADIPLEDQERKLQEELEEKIVFSGEESYGKYVDLHSFYLEYINMPQFERVEYLMFLHQFHHFHTIPRNKKNNHYKVYLNKLHAYFVDFYKRTQPLADITAILKQTESQFDVNWARGIILGWERNQLNLDKPTPVEKKEEKQGGGKRKRKRGKGKSNPEEEDKSIALCEARVERFVELLGDIIEATKIQIEKKQTRTWEEIQADFEREEQLEQHALELELQAKNIRGENSEEENKYASAAGSNPLNLPLGWDGKPIPYWLYKLHGLGNEYKCEICGNYSYWGPRAFERHFQEWRHANGMRCLKIPNTRHFHHVTKISDALELWEKIRMQADEQNWKSDAMEEYEDKDGNVFNKKTYEDLKRQGYLNQ